MKVAAVVSTKGGPGKTTVGANLGAFCADAGVRTLLIYHTLTETFSDHPKIRMVHTTIPAAVSFRRAATEGVPAHRLVYRLPTHRRSPTAFKVTIVDTPMILTLEQIRHYLTSV